MFKEEDDFVGVGRVNDLLLKFSAADDDDIVIWAVERITICIEGPRYDEFKLPCTPLPQIVHARYPTSRRIWRSRGRVYVGDTLDPQSVSHRTK